MLPAFPFLLPAYTPKNWHRHHGILFSPYLKQEVVWPKTLIFLLRFESARTSAKRERRRKLHSGVCKTLAVNSFRFDVDELGTNQRVNGQTRLEFYFLCVASQYTDYTQSSLSLTFSSFIYVSFRYLLRTKLKVFSLEFFSGLGGLDSQMWRVCLTT